MQRRTPRETDRRRPLRADGIRPTPAVSHRTPLADKRIRTGRPLAREIPFPRSLVRALVLGAVAELERSLIVERVKAGLTNAKAKGKRLGRPKRVVDVRKVAGLRTQGFGWKKISREMGIGVGTLYRLALEGSKTREKVFEPATGNGLNALWSQTARTQVLGLEQRQPQRQPISVL